MPFHWCQVETEALFVILSMIPLLGLYIKRWHASWHAKNKSVCDHKDH